MASSIGLALPHRCILCNVAQARSGRRICVRGITACCVPPHEDDWHDADLIYIHNGSRQCVLCSDEGLIAGIEYACEFFLSVFLLLGSTGTKTRIADLTLLFECACMYTLDDLVYFFLYFLGVVRD